MQLASATVSLRRLTTEDCGRVCCAIRAFVTVRVAGARRCCHGCAVVCVWRRAGSAASAVLGAGLRLGVGACGVGEPEPQWQWQCETWMCKCLLPVSCVEVSLV